MRPLFLIYDRKISQCQWVEHSILHNDYRRTGFLFQIYPFTKHLSQGKQPVNWAIHFCIRPPYLEHNRGRYQ